jgi:F0F1-type ATP synthase epsilon subunit
MIFELMEVMKVITSDDALEYFIHGGYFYVNEHTITIAIITGQSSTTAVQQQEITIGFLCE